jgi:hypothetical protein
MKSIAALLAVALALTSVSALACDGSGKMKGDKAQTTTPDKKS